MQFEKKITHYDFFQNALNLGPNCKKCLLQLSLFLVNSLLKEIDTYIFDDYSFRSDNKDQKMKSINCNKCEENFSHTSITFRHRRTAHNVTEHSCTKCGI